MLSPMQPTTVLTPVTTVMLMTTAANAAAREHLIRVKAKYFFLDILLWCRTIDKMKLTGGFLLATTAHAGFINPGTPPGIDNAYDCDVSHSK
jgi:hypothetical protein